MQLDNRPRPLLSLGSGAPDMALGRAHEATGPAAIVFAALIAGRMRGPVLWARPAARLRTLRHLRRWAFASLGPKIKVSPFAAIKRFSVQSTLWIPVADDLEGTPWLAWDRITWWNQFFFDKSFGDHFQLFTEADLLLRIPKDKNTGMQFFTPVSVFTSFFPTNKSTVYAMIQYAPLREYDPEWSNPADGWFAQYGFGAKYQLTKALEIEFLFTDFFAGKAQGAGETYTIGFRYLR